MLPTVAVADSEAVAGPAPGSKPGLRGRAGATPLGHFPEGAAFWKPGDPHSSGK